jgi:hypothetical protein
MRLRMTELAEIIANPSHSITAISSSARFWPTHSQHTPTGTLGCIMTTTIKSGCDPDILECWAKALKNV